LQRPARLRPHLQETKALPPLFLYFIGRSGDAVGDAAGEVVIHSKRRSVLAFFRKLPPRLVGVEACASSHQWSRELPRD
jgi:hypothetical protein